MNILIITAAGIGHNVSPQGFIKTLVGRNHDVDVVSSAVAFPVIKDLISSTGANFIEALDEDLSGDMSAKVLCQSFNVALDCAKFNDYNVIIYDFFVYPCYHLEKLTNTPVIRIFSSYALNEYLCKTSFYKNDDDFTKIIKNGFKSTRDCLENLNLKSVSEEICYNVPKLNILHILKDLQPYSDDFDERFVFAGPSIQPSLDNVNINQEETDGGHYNLLNSSKNKITIPFDKMKNKIIYVSMGTAFPFVLEILGNENYSDFFDKIIETYRNQDFSVIMSVTNPSMAKDLSNAPDNFFVYDFVPQIEVLKHADLFITHGGMNSVQESLYYGVPIIAMPCGFDQLDIAKQIEYLNVGGKINIENFTPELLRDKTSFILSNRQIKNNVNKLKKKLETMDSDKLTADLIENFVLHK